MGGKLLFGVLSLVLLLSSVSADNLVSNGDFSAGYLANVSLCKYDTGFLGLFPSCSALYNGTTNYLQPNNWVINYSFDAVHMSSTPNFVGVGGFPHLNLYTISEGEKYWQEVCGYNRLPSGISCSTTSLGGNTSFNPYIEQNISLNNNSDILSFSYWTPYTQIPSNFGSGFFFEEAKAPDGLVYNCYTPNEQQTAYVTSSCLPSSLFHVQLLNATTGTVIFDKPYSSLANGSMSNASIDFSSYNPIVPGLYTIVFYLSGDGGNISANGVDLANIQIASEVVPSTLGSGYIADVNTLTGIGIDSYSDAGGTLGTSTHLAKVSRNFSDFYKFLINVTFGGGHSVNGLPNWYAQDSSNGFYRMDNANIGNAVSGSSMWWFGYVPSNVTKISIDQSVDGGALSLELNVTLNNITLQNRNGWKLPIHNFNETIYESYPLLYYGFTYTPSNSRINFTAYNFRNTTSFGLSIGGTEAGNPNNIYMMDSSGNLLASDTVTITYAQEYTADYTDILSANGGLVGDLILINRTSTNNFYNSTKTVPATQFLASIFNPLSPAGGGGGGGLDINSLFNGLLGFTTGWNPSLLLMIWIAISLTVSLTVIYNAGLKVPSMSNFQSLFLIFGVIFMAGTFIGFVPVWFWGFVILFVVVLGVKQFMGERQ